MALPKQHRLGSNRDFNRVHRKGVRASTSHLAMRALNVGKRSGDGQSKKSRPQLKPKKRLDSKRLDSQRLEESAGGKPSALSCGQKSAAGAVAASVPVSPPRQPPRKPHPSQSLRHKGEIPSTFGISISKKVSKRAVVRNRIKRQIKAVLHRHLPAIAPGWQVVIVVRPSAVECEFADFLRELEYLLRKLRIADTR